MASGRNVCWFLDCDCITGLPGIPPKRIEDAMYMMQHQMNLDLRDRRGKPRKLPDREAQSQLCVEHRPALTSKRIIRATVLLLAARGNGYAPHAGVAVVSSTRKPVLSGVLMYMAPPRPSHTREHDTCMRPPAGINVQHTCMRPPAGINFQHTCMHAQLHCGWSTCASSLLSCTAAGAHMYMYASSAALRAVMTPCILSLGAPPSSIMESREVSLDLS